MAPKITTTHVFPPIPTRNHDWCASYDDLLPDGPTGWGRTEAEAIADLKDNYDYPFENNPAPTTPPEPVASLVEPDADPDDGDPDHEYRYLCRLFADGNLMRGDIEGAMHRIKERHASALPAMAGERDRLLPFERGYSEMAQEHDRMRSERDNAEADRDRLAAEVQAVLDCLHRPNPTNPHEWRVKPGSGAKFSRIADRLALAGGRAAVGSDIKRQPGFGWELSEETKAQFREMEAAQRRGVEMGNMVVGGAPAPDDGRVYSHPKRGDRGGGEAENNEGDTLEGWVVRDDDPTRAAAKMEGPR